MHCRAGSSTWARPVLHIHSQTTGRVPDLAVRSVEQAQIDEGTGKEQKEGKMRWSMNREMYQTVLMLWALNNLITSIGAEFPAHWCIGPSWADTGPSGITLWSWIDESSRSESRRDGEAGAEAVHVPLHLRNSSSVSHESRSRCEIKLWLQWFEVQAQACCAAPLSEGSLRGWIDCWNYTDTTALASLHNHLIMCWLKLSNSAHRPLRLKDITGMQL